MNLGISNVHYNVDEKQGPLYIALRTGHIYIYLYICPVHRVYMPRTEGYIQAIQGSVFFAILNCKF